MEKFIPIKTSGLPRVVWVKEWHDGNLLIDIQGVKIIVTVAFLEASAKEWSDRLKQWNEGKYIDQYVIPHQMLQSGFSMDLLWQMMTPTGIEEFLKVIRSLSPKRSFKTDIEEKIMAIKKPKP